MRLVMNSPLAVLILSLPAAINFVIAPIDALCSCDLNDEGILKDRILATPDQKLRALFDIIYELRNQSTDSRDQLTTTTFAPLHYHHYGAGNVSTNPAMPQQETIRMIRFDCANGSFKWLQIERPIALVFTPPAQEPLEQNATRTRAGRKWHCRRRPKHYVVCIDIPVAAYGVIDMRSNAKSLHGERLPPEYWALFNVPTRTPCFGPYTVEHPVVVVARPNLTAIAERVDALNRSMSQLPPEIQRKFAYTIQDRLHALYKLRLSYTTSTEWGSTTGFPHSPVRNRTRHDELMRQLADDRGFVYATTGRGAEAEFDLSAVDADVFTSTTDDENSGQEEKIGAHVIGT